MSRELPIIFNGEMVRAILDGRKTQTRRVVKHQDSVEEGSNAEAIWIHDVKMPHPCDYCCTRDWISMVPFQISDLLYVRETWQQFFDNNDTSELTTRYAADNPEPIYQCDEDGFQMFNKDGSEKKNDFMASVNPYAKISSADLVESY